MSIGVQKYIALSSEEYKDLKSYCELNLLDEDQVVKSSYLQGFRIEKYGLLSSGDTPTEIEVIKYIEVPIEKIVEKKIEVPIEVIKEVQLPPEKIVVTEYVDREVVKEVPVEKIVEKIVNIYDNSQIDELIKKTEQLKIESEFFQNQKNELLLKIQQLEERAPETIEVVKEVVVEKVVNDNKKTEMLTETLQKLKIEISDKNKKIEELEKIISEFDKYKQKVGAIYLRGSNLDETLT